MQSTVASAWETNDVREKVSEANTGWKRESETRVQDGEGKREGRNRNQMSKKKKRKDTSWKKELGVAARSHACDSSEWSNSIGPSNGGGRRLVVVACELQQKSLLISQLQGTIQSGLESRWIWAWCMGDGLFGVILINTTSVFTSPFIFRFLFKTWAPMLNITMFMQLREHLFCKVSSAL